MRWVFASDLHGREDRYRVLAASVRESPPEAVLLGGDLLPSHPFEPDFVGRFLTPLLSALRDDLGPRYPRILLILGNDDPRSVEEELIGAGAGGLWEVVHGRRAEVGGWVVYGYGCVPPTPFDLKDWERYDVSRSVDPGCRSPEEGVRTVDVDPDDVRFGTIESDLQALVGEEDLGRAVLLFHSPPYRTALDRAALDGQLVDHVQVDVHVGSIAIRRFLESRQPAVALHGHVHEAVRLTGAWREKVGRTHCLGAAHDGGELALVSFDPARPDEATRVLVSPEDVDVSSA